jgi:hypothetical protein
MSRVLMLVTSDACILFPWFPPPFFLTRCFCLMQAHLPNGRAYGIMERNGTYAAGCSTHKVRFLSIPAVDTSVDCFCTCTLCVAEEQTFADDMCPRSQIEFAQGGVLCCVSQG